MNFTLIPNNLEAPDPIAIDSDIVRGATRAVAQIWETGPALVMPRVYLRYANVDAVRAQFAARGLPVYVRASGGGLVPQGPGIINLSLAYRLQGPPGRWVDTVYVHLCGLLSEALAPFGIDAYPAAVSGSFCDGRFNLACGHGNEARKIAGTAQYWHVRPARDAGYTVLAHALLMVQPDLAAIHRELNAFESALGSGRSYNAAKTTSAARILGHDGGADLMQRVRAQLRAAVVRAAPPRIVPAVR